MLTRVVISSSVTITVMVLGVRVFIGAYILYVCHNIQRRSPISEIFLLEAD